MWRRLRRFLLFLLTVSAGLLIGVLIRFAFGHGLQWQSPAANQVVRTANPPAEDEGTAAQEAAHSLSDAAAQNDPSLVRLKAIAGRDFEVLEHLLQEKFDSELEGDNLGSEATSLITAMTGIDPLRTMAWMQKHVFGAAGRRFVYDLWRKHDPQAADAWASTHAPEMLKRAQQNPDIDDAELDRMMKEQPAQLEALLARPDKDAHLLWRVARRRATQNPAAAFAWAQSLAGPDDRATAMKETFESWAAKDPAAAAEAWKSLPKGEAARVAFDTIQKSLPQDQAIAWLRTLEPSRMVRSALAARLPDGTERDALLATLPASAADRFPISAGARLFQAIQKGPSLEAFAALVQAHRDGAAVDEGVAGILFKRDPAGTLAALQALPDGKFKTESAARIGEHIAAQPESDAMEQFAALPAGPFRDAAAERLAMGMSKTSPQEAFTFLAAQTPAARANAVPEVMGQWIAQEPAQARAAWDALPETDRRAAATELAEKLSMSPDKAGMALFSTLPDVPSASYGKAAENWIGRSPEQASAWVDTLAPGAGRDAAVASMARSLVQRDWDPERAIVWAVTIEDESQRRTSLRTTFELWSLREPAAAQSALQSLSAEDQQALSAP